MAVGFRHIARHMNKKTTLLTLASLATCVATSQADERFFTYVQDADVLPKGAWEFEQWVTYGTTYSGDNQEYSRNRWDFREEVEYGLTERFSVAGYLNFRYQELVSRQEGVPNGGSEFSFKGVSLEGKYQIFNPNTQPVGLALYLEPTFNGGEFEMEEKILISKNFGDKWVTAFNVIFEQEWEKEDGETEKESVFETTAGVAYRLSSNWSVGLEGRYKRTYEGAGFDDYLGAGWYLGPNVHYGTAKWWGTLTVLPQVAGNPNTGSSGLNYTENNRFDVRLIFGINF